MFWDWANVHALLRNHFPWCEAAAPRAMLLSRRCLLGPFAPIHPTAAAATHTQSSAIVH
jgi:hypothetical protein